MTLFAGDHSLEARRSRLIAPVAALAAVLILCKQGACQQHTRGLPQNALFGGAVSSVSGIPRIATRFPFPKTARNRGSLLSTATPGSLNGIEIAWIRRRNERNWYLYWVWSP